MLKKLRWRFILSAMTAIFAVMMILLMIINISNYIVTTNTLDSTLETLSERISIIIRPAPNTAPVPNNNDIAPSPHRQHSMTFFTVYCNSAGTILAIENNSFFSVSDEDVATLVPTIIKQGNTAGYLSGYRYMVHETSYGQKISLLSCTIELENMKNLLYVSCIVAAVSLLAVFGLVVAFSHQAIVPYINNIERQKQFITDASHELKTPITSIATSADVLAMEHNDDEWIRNIQNQTVRLSKLVGNLVTLSRLDEENPFPEASEFSLSDAIWEISEPFTTLAKAKNKCYNQNIEDDLQLVGDKASIQQMVSILLDNALKYSDADGNIRLNVYQRNKNVIIQIFNTCDHIDKTEINKLFDRFYRTDKSRSKATGGTGIGLAIAKATAEAHNGRITVSSQDNKSICFTIIL